MEHFESFLERLRSYAPLPCIEDERTRYTYDQLQQEFYRWQSRLYKLDVASGTVIALRSDYSLYGIAALLALIAHRLIPALIPLREDATQYLLDAHAAAFLDLAQDGGFAWNHLDKSPPHALIEQLSTAGDSGLIIFTSGSSGRPKAALHSVEKFLRKFSRPCRRFRTLALLVFDHVAGVDTTFYTLAAGGTLIPARRKDPRSVLALIESQKIDVLPASPSFLRMLCSVPDLMKYDLSSLKIVTYGSEPMDANTLSRINLLFPCLQITQKYGSTETGSPRTISRSNNSLWLKFRSGEVETRIVDGILWLRGHGTILGYLNAPSPLHADGWYCTGDLVDVDGDWIRFRGRETDLINVAGEKVAPVEIERVILELEFVRDVIVVGAPHALMGQVVSARIALRSGHLRDSQAVQLIRSHCRQRLPTYKRPTKIELVSLIQVSRRQKVMRNLPSQ